VLLYMWMLRMIVMLAVAAVAAVVVAAAAAAAAAAALMLVGVFGRWQLHLLVYDDEVCDCGVEFCILQVSSCANR
jgi:hypothetical protein